MTKDLAVMTIREIVCPNNLPYYFKKVDMAARCGAEWGYMEAIKDVVQYLRDYDYNASMAIHDKAFIKNFETDMNKLWEEKK